MKEVDDALGSSDPPDTLWHYTSIDAALSILQTRSVRLGCHAFMNDPGEGAAAGSIVAETWASVVDASPAHPRLDLAYLRDMKRVLSYFDYDREELPSTSILSLTELRDSLSQWARYADDGAGVALGFAIRNTRLAPRSERPWTTGAQLVRVDYDGPEDGSSSRAVVANALSKYLPRFRDPTEAQNVLIALVHRLNPIMKRAGYAEEREWRIVSRTVLESSDLYEIGRNRFGFAPYVQLQLGEELKLVELMLGPKLSAANVWSAKWLCKKFDQAPKISQSALAYR